MRNILIKIGRVCEVIVIIGLIGVAVYIAIVVSAFIKSVKEFLVESANLITAISTLVVAAKYIYPLIVREQAARRNHTGKIKNVGTANVRKSSPHQVGMKMDTSRIVKRAVGTQGGRP